MCVNVTKEPGESLDSSDEYMRSCDLSERSSFCFLKTNCYLARLVPSSGYPRRAICWAKEQAIRRKPVCLSSCSERLLTWVTGQNTAPDSLSSYTSTARTMEKKTCHRIKQLQSLHHGTVQLLTWYTSNHKN